MHGLAADSRRIIIDDKTRQPRADEHPDAKCDQRNESLCGRAHVGRRFLIDVDLACHEKEVVAHAMQQNAAVEQPHERAGVTGRK